MNAVEELKEYGIKVETKPSRSRDNPETVDKYNKLGTITPDKWYHVTFNVETNEQANVVAEKAKSLVKQGISFDTGGFTGYRDWELDWSFRYTDEVDEKIQARYDIVEDLITKISQDEKCQQKKNNVEFKFEVKTHEEK